MAVDRSIGSIARLRGLVLAGGASVRMGRDKGLIDYSGETAVSRAVRLLGEVCGETLVSLRTDQTAEPGYRPYRHVIDTKAGIGPMAGLLAAWERHPGSAWFVLAVDMPGVDSGLVGELLTARDPARVGTAFLGSGGVTEPLFAIWEPSARPLLLDHERANRFSLRRILDDYGARIVTTSDSLKLRSVNAPAELDVTSEQRAGIGSPATPRSPDGR